MFRGRVPRPERMSERKGRLVRWARELDVRWARWRHPDARKIVIDARTPMNLVMVDPVYRVMARDPRVTFWVMSSGDRREEDPIRRAADPGMTFIPARRSAFERFDAYLAADFLWPSLPRGVPRVQMFHGVAGKYAPIYDRPRRSARDWRQLWFINRRRLTNFIASGAIGADSEAARLIGMPKLDRLVDGSLQRDEVLTSVGIDPSRRSVLYAPTWSPHSSLNLLGEELVRALVAAGYAVIVKLHDRSFDPQQIHSGGVDWPARLDPILRSGGGRLARGIDSTPYLAAADAVITDHSSVGFEYLLVDRPLIRIHVPSLIENTQIGEEYVELLRAAAITAHDVRDVVNAVEFGFADPGAGSAERRAVSSELFYRPGTATSRAVHELYRLLELDPPTGLPAGGQPSPLPLS